MNVGDNYSDNDEFDDDSDDDDDDNDSNNNKDFVACDFVAPLTTLNDQH